VQRNADGVRDPSPLSRPASLAANTALPPGSGFIQDSVGNVTSISVSSNTSDSRVFYEASCLAPRRACAARAP
jgi:hypothetical protein